VARAPLGHAAKAAYSREDFAGMARATPFGGCDVAKEAIGFDILETK
jgi:hypothetical protein